MYILDSDPAEFTGLFAAFPSVSVVSVFVRTSRRAGRSGDRRHDSHPQIMQILNKKTQYLIEHPVSLSLSSSNFILNTYTFCKWISYF